MENDNSKGCLIVAVIAICFLLIIGTFVISYLNPETNTAMIIIGSLIILIGGIIVSNI